MPEAGAYRERKALLFPEIRRMGKKVDAEGSEWYHVGSRYRCRCAPSKNAGAGRRPPLPPQVTMPRSPRRVFIVDDHPVVRRGFRQLVDEPDDLTVAGEAETPAEALDRIGEAGPDLVLMDVTLNGGARGLDLIRRLRDTYPNLPVLTVSMYDETLYATRALAAGARGYVMKRVPDEVLLDAMRQVLAGRTYVSDAIRERLADEAPKADSLRTEVPGEDGGPGEDGETARPLDRLTDRELEIFLLVSRGFAPRHIAERLHVSVKTVESHRRNLRRKLELENSAELTRYAVAWRVEHGGEEP
ncbi:MAG: DNA-binding response regulator [Bacteroidetes bacterium QS_8_68_28]|nr:MAG: DNA-binding response regulator [Bacteroidetes bacterium QS_8_68_28]